MGSRSSSIPEVSRFSSIQKSSKMILLGPALALLPFLFSCGFSAHISSTTTTTPCPLGLQSETTGSPTGSPRSRRSSHSVSVSSTSVNGRNQTTRVEVRDGIETKEVTVDGRLVSKTVNGRNVPIGSPTGSPRSRRSSSVSVTTTSKIVNGKEQTTTVEVRDGIETKEVTVDGRLVSKTVNGSNVPF